MDSNRSGDTISGSGEHSSPVPLAIELVPRRIDSTSDQTEQGSSERTFGGNPEPSENTWIILFSLLFWEGGSSFDAWLSASSVQIAQVLLTLPNSFAQLGLVSGIAFQILYGFVGCWTCYVTTALYADYRSIKENQHVSFKNHTIQWFEVLGGLLGPWWKVVGLIFNTVLLFFTTTIQLVACGSTVYYINDTLSKRTWTLIFGALFMFTILIPTAKNYRLWSFLGILMTTYTAWYLTIAAALNGQVSNVKHTGANNLEFYFIGASNILYAFGGHALTVEIMHAMWRPRKYKLMYPYAILYIFSLTIPSASTMYWAFGDNLLKITNAFASLKKTRFRDAAVCVMLMHQMIEFSFTSLPVQLVWEKALGVHHSKNFTIRAISRIPIVLLIWLISLMVPFFGSINSVVGSILVTSTVYIIPCLAHMAYYSNSAARKSAIEQPPVWIFKSWRVMFAIDVCVVVLIVTVGVGFGGWSSIKYFVKQVHTFGLFAKCFQCPKK
ncbi:hypothetical protein O6H91_19G025300 [Diphasiastrum complanatum]|uniref:Uncharacterized protein n=1 Tax=Diphasiastrum complanatum TaxID=34168 RepID=A0ACC2ATK5_DIPCM|nr:hypothetical protein O6H91_19G025300 [Diphasiastrum complanatum]